MLMVVVPEFVAKGRICYPYRFVEALPGFFEYLLSERGLRPVTVDGYRHHLRRFELFLARIGVAKLSELSPSILSALIAAAKGCRSRRCRIVAGCCGCSCAMRIASARSGAISAPRSSGPDVPGLERPAVDHLGGGRPGAGRG